MSKSELPCPPADFELLIAMSDTRLLLVDDAPELGPLVRVLARRAGWRFEHCLDARAAWESLRLAAPDLLLLDVNLPGERGPSFCRRLRAEPRFARLRIALFTLPTLGEDVAEGLDAGADCLFCKDLLTQPQAWETRLREILALPHDPPLTGPVGWQGMAGLSEPDARWLASFARALDQPTLRQLGRPVLRVLFRRAVRVALPEQSPTNEGEDFLAADGRALRVDHLPAGLDPSRLIAAFAGQVERVLGGDLAAPFHALLGACQPRPQEARSPA